jgi:MarR family transcriptional regulator, organic hydroperoxide resistance regulator
MGELAMTVNRDSSPELFRIISEHGLSFTQMKALHILDRADSTSVKELADHLAMSLPAMSRSVDGLVQRDFVERTESATDRRAKLVALLPKGRALVNRLSDARTKVLVGFAAQLTDDERTALHDALLPVVERTRRS